MFIGLINSTQGRISRCPRSFSNEKFVPRGRDASYRSPQRPQRSGVPPGTFPNRWRCCGSRQGRPGFKNHCSADSVTPPAPAGIPHPGWDPARGQIVFGLKLACEPQCEVGTAIWRFCLKNRKFQEIDPGPDTTASGGGQTPRTPPRLSGNESVD